MGNDTSRCPFATKLQKRRVLNDCTVHEYTYLAAATGQRSTRPANSIPSDTKVTGVPFAGPSLASGCPHLRSGIEPAHTKHTHTPLKSASPHQNGHTTKFTMPVMSTQRVMGEVLTKSVTRASLDANVKKKSSSYR